MATTTEHATNLRRLEAAGWDLETVPQAQQDVLATLTDQELSVLIDIRDRMTAVVPDFPEGPTEPQHIGSNIF